MNASRGHIVVTLVLVSLFALFNVGLPVVQYLCPMMSLANPYCDMSPGPAEAPSITNVTPACCSSRIVAERNTTPFLQIDKFQPLPLDSYLLPEHVETGTELSAPATFTGIESFTPYQPPLYLRHSVLLI